MPQCPVQPHLERGPVRQLLLPRRGSAPTASGMGQPAQSPPPKEGTKTLEEKGEEMMKKKQDQKDPGMSYTSMVLESLRGQTDPRKGSSAGSWEEQKKAQQKQNVSNISAAISKTAVGTAPLPSLLMGKLLNLQPYETPVEGWVEGVYHPVRNLGRVIELPLPEAAGVFQWTSLGESDLQKQPKKTEVPLPNPEALGIDTLIYLLLREDMECSDTLERCVKNRSPEGVMPPHSDLVHFIAEMFASVSVAVAKPLSECGQGIPVYAAGAEIRTGSDGLTTSDWGNDIFMEAAKKVAPGLFVNVGDSKSDRGDRVEALFNISFWVKERAIDWSWLGFDSPGKEREADSLAVAVEWRCFKISERELIDLNSTPLFRHPESETARRQYK